MRASQLSFLASEKNLLSGTIVALLALLYGPVLFHWYDGWLNKSVGIEHEYFSHGLIGLPYAAYIVWLNRREWQSLPDRSHPAGAFLLALGAVFYLAGTSLWVNLSFPIVLTGLCLWLKGREGLKLQGFPLLLTALATPNPIPYLITPYTLPLQVFIAGCSGFLLQQAGFNVSVDGIYLAVEGRMVEVAPYCAGLKMLFTSLYVTLMLLHWTNTLGDGRKVRLLLASAFAISIGANVVRNALLAWFHGTGQDKNFELLHDSWGGDLYSVMMLLTIVLVFQIVQYREATRRSISPVEVNSGDE
ncbi:cyanoexosortase B [Pannus brasiliensis]